MKSGRFANVSGTAIAIVVGILALVGVLVWAVLQANEGPSTGPTGWQKAMLNEDPKLPGVYVAPHPGPDGRVCADASCLGSMDDREHMGAGVKVEICSQERLDAKSFTNPTCYNSNPPTSGPHASSPMPFKVLDNPAPKENLIHNMEHGAVVIWYNTDNQDVLNQLKAVANSNIDRRRFLVMTEYKEMEPDTIALTAWTRLDKFKASEFNRKRVQDFVDEHEKRFNPEGF